MTTTTEDGYGELVTTGERRKPGATNGSGKPAGATLQSSSNDFWIYFADVVLFSDDDNDGYYYGIDLLFDADTYYEVADVYAVLYLSLEGGPWNEYAATETFSIFGATSDDEYVVVTELEAGYPTGSYDLLIELYDAFDGAFLTSLGPIDTSELAYLPLEDFRHDDPNFDVPIGHSHGGSGALDLATFGTLALYVLAICLARRRRSF
ncbi:MAG: choice-of-anchor H family protein [Woeseiaceae bacterium]